MFEVHINSITNRLYLVVADRMEINEFQFFINLALSESRKLRPGFGVVTDISEFAVLSEDKQQRLENFMKSLKELKVGPVVRVVNPRAAMVSLQWQRCSQKAGYLADTVISIRDAEGKLDELQYQTSLGMAVVAI